MSAPMSKKYPLAVVVFDRPTAVPGTKVLMTTVVAKERRLVAGSEPYICPQPYYDPETGRVTIEDYEYFPHRIHYIERAPMAKSKDPPEENYDRFTVGRRKVIKVEVVSEAPSPKGTKLKD